MRGGFKPPKGFLTDKEIRQKEKETPPLPPSLSPPYKDSVCPITLLNDNVGL